MTEDNERETTAQLRFRVWRVRRLLAHAARCQAHMGLDGVLAAAEGPGLVLVADTAIYLASNGVDGTPLDGEDRIAFAEGFEPGESTEGDISAIAGATGTAVFIKAEDLALVLHRCVAADDLTISVTRDDQHLSKVLLVPPGARCGAKTHEEEEIAQLSGFLAQ